VIVLATNIISGPVWILNRPLF